MNNNSLIKLTIVIGVFNMLTIHALQESPPPQRSGMQQGQTVSTSDTTVQ